MQAKDLLDDERKISVFGRSEVLEIIWVLSIQEVAEAAAGRGEAGFKLLISFPSSLFSLFSSLSSWKNYWFPLHFDNISTSQYQYCCPALNLNEREG